MRLKVEENLLMMKKNEEMVVKSSINNGINEENVKKDVQMMINERISLNKV